LANLYGFGEPDLLLVPLPNFALVTTTFRNLDIVFSFFV
jgi:hypothetical protein